MKFAYDSVTHFRLLVLSWSFRWHLDKDFPKNIPINKVGLWGFLRGCLAWGCDLTCWSGFKFRWGPNWKFKMPLGEDHKWGRSWAWNMGAAQNHLCHAHQDQIMTQSSLKEMQVRSLSHTKHTSSHFQGCVLWSRCPDTHAYVTRDVDNGFTYSSCLKGKKRNPLCLLQPQLQLILHVLPLGGGGLISARPCYLFRKASITPRLCFSPSMEPTLS